MSASAFFAARSFAVVGASPDRAKFGNQVLHWYAANRLPVAGINPKVPEIDGIACHPSLAALAAAAGSSGKLAGVSVSVVTPPAVSESVLRQAADLGVTHVWFQPGSEPDGWALLARELGITAIGGGPCVLRVDPATLTPRL
ncbi:hypothetical protein LPJ53_003677 [Coemansia erecta]|uniref:CoA-binding domain-containing protein n=1 Tax=Coemansia erecta TaxID=147472 RepID=A0A9W8CSI2_9FUNG|nr:hypothetical protein LPJ53_003677 [Coemansia erecta]